MKKIILLPILLLCFISCDKDEFNQEAQQKDIQQPLLIDKYDISNNIENNNETSALKRGKKKL